MPTKIKVKTGNAVLELDAEDVKDAFRQITAYSEVFSHQKCGECGSENVRLNHRTAKDSTGSPVDYYEAMCCDCNARLSFGQHKNGRTLFAKTNTGKNGWYHYEGGSSSHQSSQQHRDEVEARF